MKFVKAHALGNDFLLMDEREVPAGADRPSLARMLCNRHRGVGADGLIAYRETAPSDPAATQGDLAARMALLNADGSYSEVSGNGVRCLAAHLARAHGLASGRSVSIETDAGTKRLDLLSVDDRRLTFRAAMGHPEDIRQRTLLVAGTPVDVVTLRVGNPQCVVLGEVTDERLHAVAAPLAVHEAFPEGTNVELARADVLGRVTILIWERGVGPTEASGTGACAAAVAAMQFAGERRDVQVISPGGIQRVEWNADGLFLTGWAELVLEGRWL